LHSTPSRFDRRANTYEDSTLQQFLFVPVQQTALQLALQLLPQARRVLDVGCGTGQLLRRARQCYPTAELVGIDLPGRMVATAIAVTPTKLAVCYVHGRAERLPFADDVFDLVSPPCPCGTGPTRRLGSPRSAECSPQVGCWSSPTSFPAADEVRPFPCCAAAVPSSRPSSAPYWPPTTWPSSGATKLVGSGSPTSRSSQRNSHIRRAPTYSHRVTRPASLVS
jgi:methyltransferase family protein